MLEPDMWSKLRDHYLSVDDLWLNAVLAVSMFLMGGSISVIGSWGVFATMLGFGLLTLLYSVAAIIIRTRQRRNESSELHLVLDEGLGPLAQLLAQMVSSKAAQRKAIAGLLKMATVSAASALVGRSKEGTRANLFKVSPDTNGETVMTLDPGCFAGRGDMSTRTFEKDHPTTVATLANRTQFFEEVEGERYATYFTHPIAGGDGVIYGALTVDCLRSGELDEEVDLPAMRLLAAFAACAYACA